MPPRTAYSPGSRTVEARVKPLSSSHSTMPAMPVTLPGATESACVATKSRAGTRCSAALTVVSSTDGLSRPFHARQPRQRGHALRHHGGVRRHPVVGQAVPGREFHGKKVGAEEGERTRQCRHALAVAANDAK